jgi:hypothetical protein
MQANPPEILQCLQHQAEHDHPVNKTGAGGHAQAHWTRPTLADDASSIGNKQLQRALHGQERSVVKILLGLS